VASLAPDYLNLRFDDDAIDKLPQELRSMRTGVLERLQSRRSAALEEHESALPPGFEDADEEPPASSRETAAKSRPRI